MPRRKKPKRDMTDQELFKSLFPKKIRDRVREEVELDDEPEPSENEEENDSTRPIKRKDK